jgi:ABC-2 type transport system ATP-binding protein
LGVLRLDNITKRYGNTQALRGVSFDCREGEVLALLGPNGAGKSTAIAIATGLLRADSGTIELGGNPGPIDRMARSRIGVAPQRIALYEDLSARENLRFFGRMGRVEAATLAERTDVLLERIGLSDRADEPVYTFSGGMKRRLNLAAALVHDPDLVLLDEPTAGVDPHSRNAILELVRDLGRSGKAVLYSTHYMEEAQRISDRVVILDHGSVMACGSVDALVASHGGKTRVRHETALGSHAEQTDEPLVTLARMLADADTLAIHVDRPDLEAVFMNLTGRSLRDP